MIYTGETTNARYGRIVLRSYAALNAVLLLVTSIGAWVLDAQANRHGIAPSTTVGFRSEHTLTSLHGWYVAQRVGFHFAAVSVTVITVLVLGTLGVAYARRLNAFWILAVPIVGGLAIGACLLIAGRQADHAAATVEAPPAKHAAAQAF